jgi:WD40 repeat protein
MLTNMTQDLCVPSPDGRFVARPGPENTVMLLHTDSRALHGRYFGHQDGVYGRKSDQIIALSWEQHPRYGLVVVSASSSGSIQRWHPRHCTHIATIRPAQACARSGKERLVAG